MNRLLLPTAGGGTSGSGTTSYTPLQLGMALKSVKSAVMRNVVLVRVWVGGGDCGERKEGSAVVDREGVLGDLLGCW